jgi:hypothetical protein
MTSHIEFCVNTFIVFNAVMSHNIFKTKKKIANSIVKTDFTFTFC